MRPPHPWEKGREGLGQQDVAPASLLMGYKGFEGAGCSPRPSLSHEWCLPRQPRD